MTKTNKVVPISDEDWYRDIVDGAPESIMVIDPEGTILFYKPQIPEFRPQDFIGTQIYDYFFPDYHETVRSTIKKVVETGEKGTYELATTYINNKILWYTTRLAPIIRGGKVVAVSLFIRDTTEQKRNEQELNRINQDLESIVAERTQALTKNAQRLDASEKLIIALRKADNWQAVAETLAEHSKKLLNFDLTGVYLLSGEKLILSTSLGHTDPPPDQLSEESNRFLFNLLQTKAIRYVSLIEEAADPCCSFWTYIHEQGMATLVIAPLRTGDTVAGVHFLGSRAVREKIPEDEQLLSAFAESSSITMHRILMMEQLEQNIKEREEELQVLYEIMSISNETSDEETLLKKSITCILKAVNCEVGVIHLVDLNGKKLKVAVTENYPDTLHNYFLLSGAANDLWERVYAEKQNIQITGLQSQSYHETTGSGVQVLNYLGIPIRTKDTVKGVISIFYTGVHLNPGQIRLIGTIADQIGLALESTIQRKHENEVLISAERQRLARELHDSISQSLYGLALSADVSNKLLKVKAYSELSRTLEETREVALQALKEMRLMLFELRPVSLEAVGLVGALELRLNTVEGRANIDTKLTADGMDLLPRAYDLDVYRIATEALNNALKHSHASEVQVDLSVSRGWFQMVIRDNGIGIDPAKVTSGGIGLSSMQERAQRIGGSVAIDSERNRGTAVTLSVPLPLPVREAQEMAE